MPKENQTKNEVVTTKLIAARVLLNCEHGAANDVVELTSEQLKSAQDAGQVDANQSAVDYAKNGL
jgi:uncharacterized iron-regulated protein